MSRASEEKPTVLIVGLTRYIKEDYASQTTFNVLRFDSGNREDFITLLKSHADFNIKVLEWGNEWSSSLTGPLDSELISHLPKAVKYICHNGAGYDLIDIAECTKRGIKVANTPRVSDAAVADVALFLMLGAMRKFLPSIDAVRRGEWRKHTQLGNDPQGKRLGILGLGGIGLQIARRARAFGMRIVYHNRSESELAEEVDAEYVSFEELVKSSDVLSLNVALSDSTKHMIGAKEFKEMKEGVVIVNTSRGAIMDEGALVTALESGQVAAAGLDVFEDEPKIHPGLLNDDKVLMLPHLGSTTLESQTKLEKLVFMNIMSALEKGKLVTQVPEQTEGVVVPVGWELEDHDAEN